MKKRNNLEDFEKEVGEDLTIEANIPRRHFFKAISAGTGAICLALTHSGCRNTDSDPEPDPDADLNPDPDADLNPNPDADPDPDPDPCENISNLENALKRIEQLAGFAWTPVAEGIPRHHYPETIPIGEERKGPPYSSVKTVGRTVGQDISIETFLSAVRNPDSVLYTIDLNDIASTGGAFYGAVCSNFIAYALAWFYSTTTTILSREWWNWGFSKELLSFGLDDIEVGDIFVTNGGGHIEMVVFVTDNGFVLFDQHTHGPRKTYRTLDYAFDRNYKLLKFDYASSCITYSPDPFSPILDENFDEVVFNDVLMLNRGNKSNYCKGEEVRVNVVSEDVQTLVVLRDGTVIESIPTSGNEIISRIYTETGNYRAYCVMNNSEHSLAEHFKVTHIEASISTNEAEIGDAVTVTFDVENCEPQSLFVEDTSNGSITNGVLRLLTEEEKQEGTVTFSHDRTGEFHVRIRALNDFGSCYTEPLDLMKLTILGASDETDPDD